MNSRAVKLAVSLLLTVSLLCCSVSVFADDPTPEPSAIPTVPPNYNPYDHSTLSLDLASYYVWRVLDSWGIHFDLGGVWQFTDDMKNWIIQFLLDYVGDLGETIGELIFPWAFDYDIWGNMRINDSALEDIQDFADWLIAKYNLQDNTQTSLSNQMVIPCENAEGMPIYIPININYNNDNWGFEWNQPVDALAGLTGFKVNYVYELTSGYYVHFVFNNSDKLHIQISRSNEFITNVLDKDLDVTKTEYYMTYEESPGGARNMFNGHDTIIVGYNQQAPTDNNIYKFFGKVYMTSSHTWLVAKSNVITTQEFSTYFMPQSITNNITTGVITLPDDDPEYNEGDSMTIVNGDPQYLVIEWDGTVTVENLPAIVSTGTIENPEVEQIYTNIPAFFQMAGDTMNGFKQILFRMPDEVLIAIYAVLAVGVIFGFLRIMREH